MPRPADAQGASTAISIPSVPGITSVADVLQPPQTTMLSIGSPRRAPVEAPDGSVKFVDMMTVDADLRSRAVDAALGARTAFSLQGILSNSR